MPTPVPRVRLANLPTPLERLDRTSDLLGIDLWVKRDDLTGVALTGNKVRKLEFLCGEALSPAIQADTLVTCGAVTSNHARATAVAAARLGLRSVLVLRGEEPAVPDGNLLLGRFVGAETLFITPEQWPDRDRLMEEVAERLRGEGRRPYVIPEGGSSVLGAWGYRAGAEELQSQAQFLGLEIAQVWHAVGSGGTTAGLALGFAGTDTEVCGVAVCDDAPYFDEVIAPLVLRNKFKDPCAGGTAWRIVEGYQGTGYAEATAEELAFYAEVAQREGLVLDPVYTGKAFRALCLEAEAGRLPKEGTIVFLHTGGIYALSSFAAALASGPT